MRLEAAGDVALARVKTGPLGRMDVRLKLMAAMAMIMGIELTPFGAWRVYGLEGMGLAFVVGLSGIAPGQLARSWVGYLVLVSFVAFTIAPGHPARAEHGVVAVVATILIKNALAILTILVLSGVTGLHEMLAGLRRLGMPAILISTMMLMDRYRHVLVNELSRMVTARRSRSFRRGQTLPWNILGGLIPVLFLRAFERAERVHGAMMSRGWDGSLRVLDDE